jgi:hypothetical protein
MGYSEYSHRAHTAVLAGGSSLASGYSEYSHRAHKAVLAGGSSLAWGTQGVLSAGGWQ